MNRPICIIGGGIAGIQCALDLSEAGQNIVILERGDAVGGVTAQLDKTFPTNDCSMCTMAPKLIELSRRPRVEIYTRVHVEDIEFKTDHVIVSITVNPKFVDEKKCISCGRCEHICPVFMTREADPMNTEKKAIARPSPQAVPNTYAIDPAKCLHFQFGHCKKCQEICPTGAINLEHTTVKARIRAAALVMATGARPYDPSPIEPLGYGKIPNIITNLEMEQMMRATGPTRGKILRPSDNTPPKRIAWVQCTGSRTLSPVERPFCSSTCCMSSVKEAFNVVQKCHNIVTDIFFIDLRAHQKGSERYYQQAKERGVNFISCRISELLKTRNDRINVRYREPGGRTTQTTYDLVVLSVGRTPNPMTHLYPELKKALYDEFGFISPKGEEGFRTNLPMVYACGTATSPKSIPHSIIEGSAAAGAIITDLSPKRDTIGPEAPQQMEVKHGRGHGKIGIFLCECGGNTSDSLDLSALVHDLESIEAVRHVEILSFACEKSGISRIKKAAVKKRLNGVVIAACSPLTHETVFKEALSPFVPGWAITMANIRDQLAWVHHGNDMVAHQKAIDQIRIEVVKLLNTRGYSRKPYPVTKKAMVLGGGISGMKCALELARMGIPVTLVERSGELGGNATTVQSTWRNTPLSAFTHKLKTEVESHQFITVLKKARLLEHTGRIGSFTSRIELEDGRHIIVTHGVTIVATGAKELKPQEYLYGLSQNVLTHLDLDRFMMHHHSQTHDISTSTCIAFIQCVGSREPHRPYCSRVCCTHSIKRALQLKEANSELDIVVFYRQLRTYGLKDRLLLEARAKGIKFIHYELEKKPVVKEVLTMDGDGRVGLRLKLSFWDPTLKKYSSIYPDYVILATAIVPYQEEFRELSAIIGIPLDEDGFFKEAHLKLRPVETIRSGVYLAGLCQYPKELDETMSQCYAVISRAYASILSRKHIILESPVATVDVRKCDGCGVCVQPCPFRALKIAEYVSKEEVKKVVEVEEANCTGCGICVATCPKEAMEVAGYEPSTIISQIDAILDAHD